MSSLLLPLVPLYAAAAAAKNLAYDRGWKCRRCLQWPVVSIGNLSVGGSGKTPLVIRLAEILRERGLAVDVLSRGYGRRCVQVERVDPGGSADRYGDEPLLIAQSAQVPVFVGASRYAAGLLAEADSPGPRLHLLDDGFQHRRLARDIDIVVLHRSDFTARLLPAGRLREPFSSLSRAQILVLRDQDADLEQELRRRGFHQPLWWIARGLAIPPVRRVVAFCGIGRPEEFFSELRRQGISVAATRAWRDHRRYSAADAAELIELRRQHQTEAFLTTEKDLVRLSPELRDVLAAAAPLHAARLVVRLRSKAGTEPETSQPGQADESSESALIDGLLAMLPAGWQAVSGSPPSMRK